MDLAYWLAIFIPIVAMILVAITSFLWRRWQTNRLIRQLWGELEKSEDTKWIEQFLRIKKRTDKIVWGVHNAILSKSLERELAALKKAVNELPALIQELNALPLPKTERMQQSFSHYISGLASYLLACQYFKIGFEQNDEESAKEGAKQIKIACDLMDKSFSMLS